MKVISAEFVTSAALRLAPSDVEGLAQGRPLAPSDVEGLAQGSPPSEMAGIPRDGLLQVALAGRSNVGKSTLINALLRRPVARTSATPGKTRLANIFRITVEGGRPGRWGLYLVDLPGYGYVRGGASAAEELRAVAEAYFRDEGRGMRDGRDHEDLPHPPPPTPHPGRMAVLLVDSRHPGLEADLQAYRWLETLGVEPLIVATKIDKLSRAERTRNLRELERIFGKPALPVSAERGEGLDELWKTIASKARAAERRRKAEDE